MDVDVVSASTIWMQPLIPASSNVVSNFSDLHALQSPEFSRTSYPNHWEAVSNGLKAFLSDLRERRASSPLYTSPFATLNPLLAVLVSRTMMSHTPMGRDQCDERPGVS
ncbi:hypothetical protein Taro_041629 [Colocasia esculenta]|uniref:Uncharacterized protein n=1 Tax=Colocasia esculenta TaxID=4460 RepID=A0A843WXT0_COLES|nr:hypothetical protein [Colocasia esculenta]